MKYCSVFFILFKICGLCAQVTLTVQVTSTSVSTSCSDGSLFGTPLAIEPALSVRIGGQSTYYYELEECPFFKQTVPFTQFTEFYNCAYPTQLEVCVRAYESDGSCGSSAECSVNSCSMYATPAINSSISYTKNVSGNGSTGSVTFTITASGTIPGVGNDLICDAIHLGTLTSGLTLGNANVSTYNNFCAGNTGEPNPSWSNEQGVWFAFTTGSEISSVINIVSKSDPQNIGDAIDLQLALYESSDQTCNGTLTLISSDYDGLGSVNNEEMEVNCLDPNTTYFLFVDGESTPLFTNGLEGYFGIELTDNGINQTADEICDALDMGLVPNGGSINTGGLSQSNACASNINDPTPTSWSADKSVWFLFQAPSSGHVIIDATSDNPISGYPIDLQLAVYSSQDGTCTGSINHVNSTYDSASFDEQIVVRCLIPGENYWLMVDGSSLNTDGVFGITISDGGVASATNNIICDAISLGQPAPGGSVGITNQNNYCADNLFEPIPSSWSNEQGVWYSFDAPVSGEVEIKLDNGSVLTGDNIDLQVSVYELSGNVCTGVPNEIISQHNDAGVDFNEDLVISCLTSGQRYWFLVDGHESLINPDLGEGDFDVTVENPDADYGTGSAGDVEPVNNSCSDAINLTVQAESCALSTGTFEEYNYGQPTVSSNAYSGASCGENCGETWYSFVMPYTGSALIEGLDDNVGINNDNSELSIVAFSGSCGSLSYLDCAQGGASSDISMNVYGPAGSTIWLQVFSDRGSDVNENFNICVSESKGCGYDICSDAVNNQMTPGIIYCFNTSYASGEDLSTDPGYFECSEGDNPERSMYFSFVTDNLGSDVTVALSNANITGGCLLGVTPTNGLSLSLFEDNTPCDNTASLVDCQSFSSCDVTPINWSNTYSGLSPNTTYVIQLDGGVGMSGGNVEGDISINGAGAPLSVSLIDFFGVAKNRSHELFWNTISEENNDYFIVEHSMNNTGFQILGKVNGHGTISSESNYKWINENPNRGISYYRLAQVDFDGTKTVLKTIALKHATHEIDLQVIPNPINSSPIALMNSSKEVDGILEIVDAYGKRVYHQKIHVNKGSTSMNLDMENVEKGVYYVRVLLPSDNLFVKIVK